MVEHPTEQHAVSAALRSRGALSPARSGYLDKMGGIAKMRR